MAATTVADTLVVIRDHRRPGEKDDPPGALPARAPRGPPLQGHRVARKKWSEVDLESYARESIEATVDDPDPDVIARLEQRLENAYGEIGDSTAAPDA